MDRTLAALAIAALVFAAPAVRAQADAPAPEKAKEEHFILVGKGELKGSSLLDKDVICEYRKLIQGVPGADSSRLLNFKFTRDVSAEQLRDVLRGLIEGHNGFTPAERDALLLTLGPMVKGSTLEFRWGSGPIVDVRIQSSGRRQAEARRVAEVIWSKLE